MENSFLRYIVKEQLISGEGKILLTISGGLDSMVMTNLFRKTDYNFSVAHCNFKLRGNESDSDEEFVKNYCEKYNIQLFVKKFNTKEYADKKGISIQMAARELRYEWFENLCDTEGFCCYATAHHKDDQIETFFINLLRGTGIAGLHGILPGQGRVIRPLLFASRCEIEDYAKKNKLSYREDSSNSETKYLRNKIRHKLLPVLKDISPNFIEIITDDIERIRAAEKIYVKEIDRMKREVVSCDEDKITIPISKLLKIDDRKILLFEVLSQYGFNFSQVEDICDSLAGIPGKVFYSGGYKLVKDREDLIIEKQQVDEMAAAQIHAETSLIMKPVKIEISTVEITSEFKMNPRPDYAFLDKDKLVFPLKIRKWKQGDFFYPLGMKNRKKLSDFLIDKKISLFAKQKIYVLLSGDDIVWVIGYRIDERYKITAETKSVFQLRII